MFYGWSNSKISNTSPTQKHKTSPDTNHNQVKPGGVQLDFCPNQQFNIHIQRNELAHIYI